MDDYELCELCEAQERAPEDILLDLADEVQEYRRTAGHRNRSRQYDVLLLQRLLEGMADRNPGYCSGLVNRLSEVSWTPVFGFYVRIAAIMAEDDLKQPELAEQLIQLIDEKEAA